MNFRIFIEIIQIECVPFISLKCWIFIHKQLCNFNYIVCKVKRKIKPKNLNLKIKNAKTINAIKMHNLKNWNVIHVLKQLQSGVLSKAWTCHGNLRLYPIHQPVTCIQYETFIDRRERCSLRLSAKLTSIFSIAKCMSNLLNDIAYIRWVSIILITPYFIKAMFLCSHAAIGESYLGHQNPGSWR